VVLLNDDLKNPGHPSPGFVDRWLPIILVFLLALTILPLNGFSEEKAGDNLPPVVEAGEEISGVLLNELVMLDGSNTTDEDIDNCTWSWRCTSHEDVDIVDNDTATPTFVVFTEEETINFELTVTDPLGESDTDDVDVVPDVNEDPELDPLSILPADSGPEGPFYEISFPLEFNATTVSDTESRIDDLEFRWESDVDGEGSFPPEPVFTRKMNILGWHNITLTVTDPNGGESTLIKMIKIREDIQGPDAVMEINPKKTVFDKGEILSLDASKTTDPNSFDTLLSMNFSWSTNISGGRILGYGSVVNLTLEEGYHNISLMVTDLDGLTSMDHIDIRVTNDRPVAVITMPGIKERKGIKTVNVTETASLSGWTSFDLNSDTLEFSWDFGDGGKASGVNVTHEWDQYGEYNITLEVDDGSSYDNLANTTTTIAVNTIPQAVIETPGSIVVGDPFLFSANGTTDEDGDELDYKWDLDGDGVFDQSGFNTTFTYREEGEFTITLQVSDGFAISVAEVDVNPKLPNEVPLAKVVGWQEGDDPLIVPLDDDRGEIELDATASIDPDDDANNNGIIDDDERSNLTFSWDLDADNDADRDGIKDNDFTKKGKTVRVQLEDDDLIRVRLNATDERGVSSYLVILVQGDNPPDVTNLNSNKKFKIYVNSTVDFTSTASDPDSGQTRKLKYNWDFGDGTIKNDTTSTQSHKYTASGTYEIYSWVTDGYLWGYSRATITVIDFEGLDIRFPRNGATLKGRVLLRGSVDYLLDYRIERVEVRIDGGEWEKADNPPDWEYSLNTNGLTDGKHELEVKAILDTGVEQTVSVEFTVSNAVEEDNSGLIAGIVIFIVVLIVVVIMFFLLFGKRKSRAHDLLGPIPPPGAGPRIPGMVPPGGLPKPPQKANLPPTQSPPAAEKKPDQEPPKEEGPKPVRVKCPSCKRVFKVDDTGERPLMMTCTHCGAKGSISQVPGDAREDEEEEEEVDQGPEPISIICPSCKGLFELDHVMDEATCPFCNAKGELDEETKDRLKERFGEEEKEDVTVRCPSCQGKFSIKSTDKEIICPYCGVSGNV
jgi:DNA-directed RNA polymerase subunit RPC12/RpoP